MIPAAVSFGELCGAELNEAGWTPPAAVGPGSASWKTFSPSDACHAYGKAAALKVLSLVFVVSGMGRLEYTCSLSIPGMLPGVGLATLILPSNVSFCAIPPSSWHIAPSPGFDDALGKAAALKPVAFAFFFSR